MTTSTPSNNSSGSGSSSTSNSIKCNNSNTNNDSNNNSNSNRQSDSERTTSAAIAVVAGAAAAAAATTTTTLYNDQHSPSVTASAANIGSTSTNRVMQADEDFNIRFVNLVRTHRCLYDKKVPEYRNRDNQEKAWALISTETCESVIHCKERWRNLRACLSRYIKQQSGSEPQHKPYYLTEHMAFLLPFLKSTRNSLDGNNSLASLYQFSQQHLHLQHQHQHQHQQLQLQHQQHQQEHLYCNNNNNNNNSLNTNNNNNIKNESMELKHSMSENDDEETIDAFDPAIAATLGLHRSVENAVAPGSPAHSETASASSLQNFIPDVQLAESGQDLIYDDATSTPMRSHHPHHHLNHHHQSAHPLNHHQQQQQQHQHQHQHQQSHFEPGSAKRIKTECEATTTTSSDVAYFGGLSVVEHTDMEFFRSILPDIAALTPQQRRKFKIGILELIDDVVERYPSQERYSGGSSSAGSATAPTGASAAAAGGSSSGSTSSRRQRHNSGRDWRK